LWQEVEEYEEKKKAAESRGEKLPTSEEVNHKIPFHSVLLSFLGESLVDDFFSPAIQANSCCGSESWIRRIHMFLGSGSIWQRSGSLDHQAKIVKKTLIPTFCDFCMIFYS
jgi:hypothetical protein